MVHILASLVVAQGKIVRQEKINIDASYEKKAKQGEIQKKMFAPSSLSATLLTCMSVPLPTRPTKLVFSCCRPAKSCWKKYLSLLGPRLLVRLVKGRSMMTCCRRLSFRCVAFSSAICGCGFGRDAQGLYSLMEKDIQVYGRKKDKDALQKAVDSAKETFKEKSGFEVKVEVKDGLPDDGSVLLDLCVRHVDWCF